MKEFWNQYSSWKMPGPIQHQPAHHLVGTIVINIYEDEALGELYMDRKDPRMLRMAEEGLVNMLRATMKERMAISKLTD